MVTIKGVKRDPYWTDRTLLETEKNLLKVFDCESIEEKNGFFDTKEDTLANDPEGMFNTKNARMGFVGESIFI